MAGQRQSGRGRNRRTWVSRRKCRNRRQTRAQGTGWQRQLRLWVTVTGRTGAAPSHDGWTRRVGEFLPFPTRKVPATTEAVRHARGGGHGWLGMRVSAARELTDGPRDPLRGPRLPSVLCRRAVEVRPTATNKESRTGKAREGWRVPQKPVAREGLIVLLHASHHKDLTMHATNDDLPGADGAATQVGRDNVPGAIETAAVAAVGTADKDVADLFRMGGRKADQAAALLRGGDSSAAVQYLRVAALYIEIADSLPSRLLRAA